MLDVDVFLLGNLVSQITQLLVVSLVHVRESGTGREVLAPQRMLWEEVDMVVDNHQVTDFEVRIHTSRCIAYEEGLDAQFVHHALREGNLLHVISFIVMESAFHCHDVLAAQLTEDEFAGMAFYGRNREVGYLAVWKFITISYF